MRRKRFMGTVALASAGLLLVGVIPASASTGTSITNPTQVVQGKSDSTHHHGKKHKVPKTKVVAEGLAGPLSFSVERHNKIYVGQAFSGAVTLLRPGKNPTDVVVGPGMDVAAVSAYRGSLTWAETTVGENGPTDSVLMRKSRNGKVRTVANLFAYERKANPDSHVKYGPLGLSKECKASLPADLPPELSPYKGGVDSHPYGSVTRGRVTYVADAGANAIFQVTKSGHVSTLAVLPPATFEITAELAEGVGLPDCTVGHKFALESVPTDVEVGRGGFLYVSTLPGGPADGSLGNMGSVYRVNPWNGNVKLVATGFAGATGLAIGHHGTIYVAELYANRVSTVDWRGHVRPLITLNEPAAVEYRSGKLFVSTDVFGDGKIVSMRTR